MLVARKGGSASEGAASTCEKEGDVDNSEVHFCGPAWSLLYHVYTEKHLKESFLLKSKSNILFILTHFIVSNGLIWNIHIWGLCGLIYCG